MKTFKIVFIVAVLLTFLSAAMVFNVFAAVTQPDLTIQIISSISPLPEKTDSGSSFTVTTKIKNAGKKQSLANFSTQYYLSSDKSFSSDDILLSGSRTVSGLKSKKTVIGHTNLTITPSTPSGTYYLVACVDDKNVISESNENNNCSASKKTINVTNNTFKVSIPPTSDVVDVPLIANQLKEIAFSYDLGGAQNYENVSVDLQNILSNSVTLAWTGNNIMKFLAMLTSSSAIAVSPAYISMRIGPDVATVCQDGLLYGPFTVTGTKSSPLISPATVTAAPSSVSIINSGSFAMCIQVFSPVDATVSANNFDVDVTPCNENPANIGGTWKGKYTCINTCGGMDCSSINKSITFTVTQDKQNPRKAFYDDDDAHFEGTVCGKVFKFDGGEPGEKESGTFILNNNGTATKNSTWYAGSYSWGTCTDEIHRIKK